MCDSLFSYKSRDFANIFSGTDVSFNISICNAYYTIVFTGDVCSLFLRLLIYEILTWELKFGWL